MNTENRRKRRVYKMVDKRLADNDQTRELILFMVIGYLGVIASAWIIATAIL